MKAKKAHAFHISGMQLSHTPFTSCLHAVILLLHLIWVLSLLWKDLSWKRWMFLLWIFNFFQVFDHMCSTKQRPPKNIKPFHQMLQQIAISWALLCWKMTVRTFDETILIHFRLWMERSNSTLNSSISTTNIYNNQIFKGGLKMTYKISLY